MWNGGATCTKGAARANKKNTKMEKNPQSPKQPMTPKGKGKDVDLYSA